VPWSGMSANEFEDNADCGRFNAACLDRATGGFGPVKIALANLSMLIAIKVRGVRERRGREGSPRSHYTPPCISKAIQLIGQIANQIATSPHRHAGGKVAIWRCGQKEEEYQDLDIMLHCADRQIANSPSLGDVVAIWVAICRF